MIPIVYTSGTASSEVNILGEDMSTIPLAEMFPNPQNPFPNPQNPRDSTEEKASLLPLSVVDAERKDRGTSPGSTPSSSKLLYLEGLRGLAAWAVANAHLGISYLVGESWLMNKVQTISIFWGLSVAIFFVLSGRVLVVSFLKRRDLSMISSAAVKRPFRLGLPLMATFLLQIILYHIGWGNYAQEKDHPDYHSVFNFLWAIPRYFVYGTTWPYPIFVQWTISHEFWNSYYVYLYVVVIAFLPRNKYLFHAIVIFLCYCFRMWSALFFFGVLLSDLIHEGYIRRFLGGPRRFLFGLRIVLAALIIFLRVGDDSDHSLQKWFNKWQPNPVGGNFEYNENWEFWRCSPIVSLGAMAFVLFLEITPLAQRFFALRPFVFLGDISYMLYLVHPLVYHLLGKYVIDSILNLNIGGFLSMVSIYFILMAVNFAVAYVLYRIVDLPSVRLTKWIDDAMFGRRPPETNLVRDAWIGLKRITRRCLKGA